MFPRQARELGDALVQRMFAVEVRLGGGCLRTDQVVVVVFGDHAGEHILAGQLVAAIAGEALLVTVVNDGVAT